MTDRAYKRWLSGWGRLGLRIRNHMVAGGVPWQVLWPANGNRDPRP